MAADVFNYDDLADLRYNSFANEGRGEYYPKTIGFGITDSEERTISSISPFIINLFESPLQTVPSSVEITLKSTGEVLKEVSKGDPPANKQYAINYEEEGNGQVFFNSGQAGQIVYINYKGLGTIHQRSTLKFQILGSSTTKIVASSDSSIGSQDIADEIILTSDDAGAKINNIITDLAAIGGGGIKVLEGSYNSYSIINGSENIKIEGSGHNTKFYKTNNSSFFLPGTANNMTLKDFSVYANGYSVDVGIEALYLPISITNIIVDGCLKGFSRCNHTNNCRAINCNIGFSTCKTFSNCEADTCTIGFSGCDNGNNSIAHDCVNEGFKGCENISSFYSYSNGREGFNLCVNITSSYSESNGFSGYSDCAQVSACFSLQNTQNGFSGCDRVTSCRTVSNTLDGYESCENVTASQAAGNTVNGFDNCKAMGFNYSTGNGTDYNNCFSDRAGLLAVADNANGGFNG